MVHFHVYNEHCGCVIVSHCAVNVSAPLGLPGTLRHHTWWAQQFGFGAGLVLSRLSHPFPSPFFPFSLFPVCRLVRCSELANSAVGVVLVARMTLLLMGSCQTPPAYGEANDLLDGWAAMDISAPRVSGVEWRLRRAQCRPVRVHGTPDRDGI